MDTREIILLSLVRSSLWGTQLGYEGRKMNRLQYQDLMELAEEQTVVGIVAQGLMESGVKMDADDVPMMYAAQQLIRQRNKVLDMAVAELCQMMSEAHIRIFVFKGQTIATYYPDSGLRQCGDIDFYCYPDDWDKAVQLIQDKMKVKVNDLHTSKDVSFTWNGIVYEMHCKLTLFCYPPHSKYWEQVIMPEIRKSLFQVDIQGQRVATLPPTYNALYIFVHIFQHLIADGIGLRQFCDWAVLLKDIRPQLDVEMLQKHLNGLGLLKAYSGLGALMTDYLGYPEADFPFTVSPKDHKRASKLIHNVFERGNFGHNVKYTSKNMWAHGLEHIGRMTKQAREFYHYAPAEAWWHLPSLVGWWVKKIWRLVAHMFHR